LQVSIKIIGGAGGEEANLATPRRWMLTRLGREASNRNNRSNLLIDLFILLYFFVFHYAKVKHYRKTIDGKPDTTCRAAARDSRPVLWGGSVPAVFVEIGI
jgi:hypothetical protein